MGKHFSGLFLQPSRKRLYHLEICQTGGTFVQYVQYLLQRVLPGNQCFQFSSANTARLNVSVSLAFLSQMTDTRTVTNHNPFVQ